VHSQKVGSSKLQFLLPKLPLFRVPQRPFLRGGRGTCTRILWLSLASPGALIRAVREQGWAGLGRRERGVLASAFSGQRSPNHDPFVVCPQVHGGALWLPAQSECDGRFCSWTALALLSWAFFLCHSSFSYLWFWWCFLSSSPLPPAHTHTHTLRQAGTWLQSPFNGLWRNVGLQSPGVVHDLSY